MKLFAPVILAMALLAGCANLPTPILPEREAIRDFSLEGRFALRTLAPGDNPQNAAGRLEWTHQPGKERILLANPLGHALAEIEITPGQSLLRMADGKSITSDDPDSLLAKVTGQRLPVTRLPGWLLGRGSPGARFELDTQNRPIRLQDNGWQITYAYDTTNSGALPSRLTLVREGEIELKLRIESWREWP